MTRGENSSEYRVGTPSSAHAWQVPPPSTPAWTATGCFSGTPWCEWSKLRPTWVNKMAVRTAPETSLVRYVDPTGANIACQGLFRDAA